MKPSKQGLRRGAILKAMHLVILVIGLAAWPQIAAGQSVSVGIQLRCTPDNDIFVLRLDSEAAEYVSASPPRYGKLDVGSTEYLLKFPKTARYYELWVKVNRYTGKMEIEFGTPPFFVLNWDNVRRSGECGRSEEKTLF